MGLFSSRKKIYVSSVIYNLAGSPEDRPDYLKSVILGNILTAKRYKAASVIKDAYISGVGMRLRRYHRWCRTNFRQVGIPTDRFYGQPDFIADEVAYAMEQDLGIKASIDWIDSGDAEIEMWGRQWLRDNIPEVENSDTWTVDYIEATNEALINFSDGSSPQRFNPVGYRPRGRYLYVGYSLKITSTLYSTPKLLIYQRGTGSELLDDLLGTAGSTGEYLPFIPIRHETKFISESYKPNVYKETQKAYKKAVGQPLEDLIDKIKDNPDLDEIDFAYVMFGVSMNTKDMASRRYLFRYFKLLASHGVISNNEYTQWSNTQEGNQQAIEAWLSWYLQNQVGGGVGFEPDRPALTNAPSNSVLISDRGPGQTNMKMEIKWNRIVLTDGFGLAKVGAKKGDVWFTFAGGRQIVASSYSEDEVENLTIDTVEMYHQIDLNNWEKLTLTGLTHINHIYEGKYVEITAAQALVDEDDSGFLVPIRYDTFKEMSLVDSTQVGTQCANIVFNCYQVVKKKWYQRGWFKVFLIIAIVILSIYFPPLGLGTGSGLLGTSASVGAALGFTGVAALVAGTLANMVAAMVVTKLITFVSVELLGEKIGLIVAAIASMVAIQAGTMLQSGQSMASIWSSFMSAPNLLNLTNSVGNAYAGVIQADTMDIVKDAQKAADEYREQSLKLQENYAEQFGYGTALFNPMDLTQVGQDMVFEPSDAFLSRTLLTGSEIAQMGNDMITNFVELTLRNQFYED